MTRHNIIRVAFAAVAATLVSTRAGAQCTTPVQRLLDERKFDEAKSGAERLAPDDQAADCLGRISLAMNRAHDAVGHFEKAIKLNDRSSSHHLWLGNSLGGLADSTSKLKLPFLARRVKSEFDRAVQLDPRSIDARHGLVQFYVMAPGVMGGSKDKARDQAREIGKLNAMRGHLEMATILASDSKPAEAEQELIVAEKESPDSAAAPLALALFYVNRQRWPDAFATYDRVARKFPLDVAVHYQVGRAAAISGQQLDRGEKEMKSWLASPPRDALAPTVSSAHWRLGMIYEKQGKKDLARAEYNTALTIDQKNDNAKKSLAALK